MATGDLIRKNLPRYKLTAMDKIAETCYQILKPHLGGGSSLKQFLNLSYTIEGWGVKVDHPSGSCLIVVYGDPPRVVYVLGRAVDSKEGGITWDTAQKVVKAINELEKNLPSNLGYYERVLKSDFNIAYQSLRFWGAQGTRVHYKGVK